MAATSVWVAEVDTYYRAVGVGVTQAEAIKVASTSATPQLANQTRAHPQAKFVSPLGIWGISGRFQPLSPS